MATALYANDMYMGREFSPHDKSDEPPLVWGFFCNGTHLEDCGFFVPITDPDGPGITSAEWANYDQFHHDFHMSRVKVISLIPREGE